MREGIIIWRSSRKKEEAGGQQHQRLASFPRRRAVGRLDDGKEE